MVERISDFFDEVTFFVEVKSNVELGPMSFIDSLDVVDIFELIRSQEVIFWTRFPNVPEPVSGNCSENLPDRISVGSRRTLIGGSLSELRRFFGQSNNEVFAFLSYDLKNNLEQLESKNPDHFKWPSFVCHEPERIVSLDKQSLEKFQIELSQEPINLVPSLDREEYIAKVESIKRHIQLGDIYEMNFCFEHIAEDIEIDPILTFAKLLSRNENPFSTYLKTGDLHCICSSPERFMAKHGKKVFSQPMKGTIQSSTDECENQLLANQLKADSKERAENIMITDLVRNDLSKVAKSGSVVVDELCEVYQYGSVNQMISTVSCELKDGCEPIDAVLGAFPMGSMTGAPKHRAMQLIDQYEDFSRGIFSGSIGSFKANGDFDLNVVIRSLIYDEKTKRLSLPTGSAITIHSDPEKEYNECLLKAQRIKEVLNGG